MRLPVVLLLALLAWPAASSAEEPADPALPPAPAEPEAPPPPEGSVSGRIDVYLDLFGLTAQLVVCVDPVSIVSMSRRLRDNILIHGVNRVCVLGVSRYLIKGVVSP